MKDKTNRRYVTRIGIFLVLLFILWLIAGNGYRRLPWLYEDVVRIGVFSDSYWEVQNGYA